MKGRRHVPFGIHGLEITPGKDSGRNPYFRDAWSELYFFKLSWQSLRGRWKGRLLSLRPALSAPYCQRKLQPWFWPASCWHRWGLRDDFNLPPSVSAAPNAVVCSASEPWWWFISSWKVSLWEDFRQKMDRCGAELAGRRYDDLKWQNDLMPGRKGGLSGENTSIFAPLSWHLFFRKKKRNPKRSALYHVVFALFPPAIATGVCSGFKTGPCGRWCSALWPSLPSPLFALSLHTTVYSPLCSIHRKLAKLPGFSVSLSTRFSWLL